MKKRSLISLTTLIVLVTCGFTACKDGFDTEIFPDSDVAFTYSSPSMDYLVGEEVTFMNTSVIGSTWMWDFGDGTTSTEKSPVHKFTEAKTFKVMLTVDGGKHKLVRNVMISDIVPRVRVKSATPFIIYNQTEVSFEVLVANPENLPLSFTWSFPKGTLGDAIDENGGSTSDSPEVVFRSVGSQKVNLVVKLGERNLDAVTINVKVNYDKPAKTLYYAVKGGNIMSRKLIQDIDPSLNNSFDLGFRSGKHPLTLQFSGDWLYVFDAGTKFAYVADPLYKTAGDGEIFVISHDGSKRESVIENFGGDTFMDFYYGYVDSEEGQIYWSDRREGIMKTSVNTRNKKFTTDEFKYFVRNTRLGYYGNGIAWGNINGTFTKYNGQFWWAKNSTGSGIYRFTENDILSRDRVEGDPIPAAGALFVNLRKVRCFVIDPVNQKLYYSTNDDFRLRRCNVSDGTGTRTIDLAPFDGEGGVSEGLYITGMAIDVAPDGTGYLYYAYRGPQVPAGTDPEEYYAANPLHRSGIKRVSLTADIPVVEYFIKDVEAYGIAIDNTLR
jgi:PKD repeat protein